MHNHTVSDVIFNFEKSDLTPHYATVESSMLAKSNFHTPTYYVPDFYFYFKISTAYNNFFKRDLNGHMKGPSFTSIVSKE